MQQQASINSLADLLSCKIKKLHVCDNVCIFFLLYQLENAKTKEDVGALKESDGTIEIASETDNIVLRKLLVS